MTYKVTLSGGTKEETMESVKRQVEGAMERGNMSRESGDQLSKLLEAMPGERLSGTISDNNNGTVVISVTARTEAPATVAARSKSGRTGNAQRPMEGVKGNSGGEVVNRSTTGQADAQGRAGAAASAVKPDTSAKPTAATTAASGGNSGGNAGGAGAGAPAAASGTSTAAPPPDATKK